MPSQHSGAVSWEALFSIYLPAMLLALGVGIALPAIPSIARSFDVSFGVASFVLTAYLVGGLAGSIPTGWLMDRIGRRPIMIAGPLLSASMALLVLRAESFPELLAYRFVDGWAGQMWLLARLNRISYQASADQRGRQVSWMYGMDSVGQLAGPVVGGFVAAGWGERAPFAAYAVLALVALIPTVWMAEGQPAHRSPQGGAAPRTMTIAEIVLPRLPYFGVVFFSAMARGPLFVGVLFLYAAYAYGLDAAGVGLLASFASGLGLPIGFLAGWLMDRFGRKVTMVPGFFGVAVTMMLIAATAFLELPLTWFLVAFGAGVTAQSLTGGSIQTIGADVAPPEARGMFLGLWRFTAQVGTTLSPMIFAFLADRVGYGFGFTYVAVSALATTLLLVTRVPETAQFSREGRDSAVPSRA